MAFSTQSVGAAQRASSVVDGGRQQRRVGGLCVEGYNVDLVGVASVVHGQVAKHAVEADVGQVGRLLCAGLGLCLDLGVLVDVGHGRDGAAAGADAGEAGDGGLGGQRGAAGVQCGAGRGRAGPAKGTGAGGWQRRRLCARRGGLGVEQDRLGHGGRLVLGDDDAAVARMVEVDLRQRPIVGRAGGQGRGVQRIRLAVGVVEGAGVGVQQVSRVALFGGRVERRRRASGALARAEQVADHVWQRAHSSWTRAGVDDHGSEPSRQAGVVGEAGGSSPGVRRERRGGQ